VETLRGLLRRQPFHPFEVELIDGTRFTVDRADAVSLGGGTAGFIGEDQEIYFFDLENTRQLGGSVNGVSA
jgi:hypothetical protein